MITYAVIALLLLALEILYFKVAERFGIVDKPNSRSSHSVNAIRGGGIIFLLAAWVWSIFYGIQYPFMLAALTIAAGVSFIDDIHSLPDSTRLVAQFVAMILMFCDLHILIPSLWWGVPIALVICVGATNIFNFMDGINGLTGAYSLAVLIPLIVEDKLMANGTGEEFIVPSFLYVIVIAVLVFCLFNFRPKNKAKCFAGDVGSIGMAFILLFSIGKLVMRTSDVTWLVLLLVYGVDGILTICHRIMLHENLGEAHRKHAYQLMANELKMNHIVVSLLYMAIQMLVSFGFIFLCPDTVLAHWLYLIGTFALLAVSYLLFMKKYYHLHEEYLASIGN